MHTDSPFHSSDFSHDTKRFFISCECVCACEALFVHLTMSEIIFRYFWRCCWNLAEWRSLSCFNRFNKRGFLNEQTNAHILLFHYIIARAAHTHSIHTLFRQRPTELCKEKIGKLLKKRVINLALENALTFSIDCTMCCFFNLRSNFSVRFSALVVAREP